MKGLLLWAIRMYQRYVSPYKGYSCAYRIYKGGAGCSGYGYRVIERHGPRKGLALLHRRLNECGAQMRLHQPRMHPQAGSCDLPDFDCGGCDASCGDALDVADCCTSVGDCWPGSRREPETSAEVEKKIKEFEQRRRKREQD
jgi:putative component of membrane protein insertase Oxa1/YidC/SpoIIIJ protein YidD